MVKIDKIDSSFLILWVVVTSYAVLNGGQLLRGTIGLKPMEV